jgi:hypothetical protein
MEITYIIIGGGQKVKESFQTGEMIVIQKTKTDYSEKSESIGQNHNNIIWGSYLADVIDMAKEWVSNPDKLRFTSIEK